MRSADVQYRTAETEIEVSLQLDGHGEYTVETGLGFLDHLLAQLALHALFDLKVRARGDLKVDPHHTVEDVALALGQALDRALGNRAGIVRIAAACVPMDEALAFVAVDLSGRPYARTDVSWNGHAVGDIPVTLFAHFLRSLATTSRATIHAWLLEGEDDHHKAEALFKALGRALDSATRLDPRRGEAIPSTKRVL
ncbi:MAG: imidazoleglycerol-phosphate dehydratase HisB [Chloroflexia bacterium]